MSGIKSITEEAGAGGGVNGPANSSKNQNGIGNQFQIAICGVGMRLSGGIRSTKEFWDSLTSHLDARISAPGAQNKGYDIRGGRLSEGLNSSDAPFFTTNDEGPTDYGPYGQKLLEVTRECLEDACEVSYHGQDACVATYVAMPGQKESEAKEVKYTSIADHISQKYDLQGPSVTIENAEGSASLLALHEACNALRNGDAKAALVAGINLMTTTETPMDALDREAVVAVFIKPVSDAIRDGNPIQAVICATSAYHGHEFRKAADSRASVYETLIREAYDAAGMDPRDTAIIECHDAEFAGNKMELSALERVFGGAMPPFAPLTMSLATQKVLRVSSQIQLHHDYAKAHPELVSDIAYTRATRREALNHRAFSILGVEGECLSTANNAKCPGAAPSITMVFSGQGAQWAGMGKELFQLDGFRDDIKSMDNILRQLKTPPSWTIEEEIQRPSRDSLCRINSVEIACTLSTALQIALLHQFERLGVTPEAVIGHSSGEIAAAYAAGYLTLKGAIIVAYYYGSAAAMSTFDGAMAVTGLSTEETKSFLRDGAVVACENSPLSTTISGDRNVVEEIMASIKMSRPQVTTRKLHVGTSFHSHHMESISTELLRLLETEENSWTQQSARKAIFMSSVSNTMINAAEELGPKYWLSTTAYRHGIRLSPIDIVENPELARMAAVATIDDTEQLESTEPFSLMPKESVDGIKTEIQKQCNLSAETIEDIYPCTTLQQGFMALGLKQPGSYIHRQVYKLLPHVDIDHFMASWDVVIRHCGSLRSRIALVDSQALQAVVATDTAWEAPVFDVDVNTYLNETRSIPMSYGDRLSRNTLLHQDNGDTYFIWIIHHAVFDGLSMKIVLDALQRAYHTTDSSIETLPPYSNFIRYIGSLDSDGSSEYWRKQLEGSQRSQFPASSISAKSQDCVMKKSIPFQNPKALITTATIIRATWALVLAQYCGTDDVCFGMTLSGRQAPVPGLNEIPGPMIATVPIRIQINREMLVSEFLQNIHQCSTSLQQPAPP
ncbi:putative PKS/NRPS-like protein biosynthetic cluster [Trichoderma virens FT-333]|nr:putative PKS/NRPS-like protein biosynthetic cluster [Trichoderma virens FT-333]